MTVTGKLDVHAHFLPEPYRELLDRSGHDRPDGMPQIPQWSPEAHLAVMDQLGIATSLLSISTPGVHISEQTSAAELAGQLNDIGRRTVVDHPGRFGLLASLPLPDVDATINEIGRCVDELHVDGFILLTNVAGTYLGDPEWEPVFDELDRHGARVLVHPTSPVCWEHTTLGRPRPMLEFLFDTTRAVVNMILNGTIARHPNLRLIIPHAGATLPVIADRVAMFSMALDIDPSVDVMADLAGLHFDLSGTPLPRQLPALLEITSPDHLHFGSDYPFTPDFVAAIAAEQLDTARLDAAGKPAGSLTESLRANTLALFPRLAGRV